MKICLLIKISSNDKNNCEFLKNIKMLISSTYLQGEGHFLVQPRLDFLYFFVTLAKHFAEIIWNALISKSWKARMF